MEASTEEKPTENLEVQLPQDNQEDYNIPIPPMQETSKKSKKDDKNVEQFMKSLNSLPTLEEKLAMVCKKYVQTADENKKYQFYIKQSDRRHGLLQKSKEHLQHEFNKTILVKSKLENLCRELQKQNKAIKEESLLKIREEEERRKETQAKFQNTLSEITTLLQQNNEKNAKLRDDNISMSDKFTSIVQQYQLREQQIEKLTKQMELEGQLSDAKLQKASLEHQAEKERLIVEIEELKMTVAQIRAKIIDHQQTETALKGQLAVYTDKYDEFQSALVKSNQVFGSFKEQMEVMSKKIKKLEKESLSWKKRWETSQTALLDMCSERQTSEERAAATARQLLQMQSLCRTLQAERTVLLNTLKENKIERPPLPAAPPAPAPVAAAPASASDSKVDAMVANCAQLRQSLAHLQSQLNVLTTNKNAKEEPPKAETKKKSKSKKNKSDKQPQKNDNVEMQKETESDESNAAKEISKVELSANDETNHSDDKIDEKTMESLIQAINMANVNLSDLEVDSIKIKDQGDCGQVEGLDVSPPKVDTNNVMENIKNNDTNKVSNTVSANEGEAFPESITTESK